MQKKRSWLGKCWRIIWRTTLWMFLTSLAYIIICRWVMPPITLTQLSNSFSYGLKRDYVGWNKLPYNLKLAAIASEDQTFPDHSGFDWDALEKSLRPRKKGKKTRIPPGGGASTISQQTAKNVFLWQGSGVGRTVRKGLEFYFTQMIEWIWGKKRILEVYLNVIETGPGIFGMEASSQHYFKKSAAKLSRAEAAMLIASLPNPKKFLPKPTSSRVAWRYPQILKQMQNIEDDPDIQELLKGK